MTDGLALAEGASGVQMPQQARWRFNRSPKKAVEWLMSEEAFAVDGQPTDEVRAPLRAADLAQWLLTEEGLSTAKVGEFLGGSEPLCGATLTAYVSKLSLAELSLDTALRYFLSLFKLPGEAQQIAGSCRRSRRHGRRRTRARQRW